MIIFLVISICSNFLFFIRLYYIESQHQLTIEQTSILKWLIFLLAGVKIQLPDLDSVLRWSDDLYKECRTMLFCCNPSLKTGQRPYSQTQSSWSMIRDFSNDDIFIVIFNSSGSNNHDEQICSLIGPAWSSLKIFSQ